MKQVIWISLNLTFLFTTGIAQTKNPLDIAAIEKLAVTWQNSWNAKDADGLTSILSDSIEFVTVLGPKGWLKGRQQFREVHAKMFNTLFTESKWMNKGVDIKFLRPDIAVARVLWETVGDKVRHRKHGELREGIFMWVVEKKGEQWLVVASQNTENMPILPGQ